MKSLKEIKVSKLLNSPVKARHSFYKLVDSYKTVLNVFIASSHVISSSYPVSLHFFNGNAKRCLLRPS